MLSCPQSIGGLALLLTRALSFFHGGIHPRLQVAHRALCEIATTSPNGVTRFCNGLPSRRILAGRASADVDCRFVLTFSEINNVPREPIWRPFSIPRRPFPAAQSTFDNFNGDP
jgi:hypothetical protein